MTAPKLPVPVLEHPHWRVNMRPLPYEPERIPSLSACFDLIQALSVLEQQQIEMLCAGLATELTMEVAA